MTRVEIGGGYSHPAQSAAEGVRASTTRATAAALTRRDTWWRRSWCSGSDDEHKDTGHKDTKDAQGAVLGRARVVVPCVLACPVALRSPSSRCGAARHGAIRGRVELRRVAAAGRAAAERRRPRHAGRRATSPIGCGRSSTWSRRRAARSRQIEGGHAVMDQRNETFVPHVLAITTGTTVDFPNSDRIYHNVFSLSKTRRVRSRPLRRRATRSRSASTGPASSACSATSTRT